MIPVNGKPVIAWILEDIIRKGITAVTLVMRSDDTLLDTFVGNLYLRRVTLDRILIDQSESILDSLLQGIDRLDDEPLGIVLGDTLIRDNFHGTSDFVYIHEVHDSHRWCLVQTDSSRVITRYLDKIPGVPPPCNALCGYYYFTNVSVLRDSLKRTLAEGKRQLSDMLTEYQREIPITAVTATEWFDFGNIDNLIRSKQLLLQSRYFNSLTVNPLLNAITKVSEFDEKLRNELSWYESIPDEIKVLSPRIISKQQINGKLHMVQEYYGYPTLAELFIYSNIDSEIWSSIFQKLLEIHKVFRSYPSDLDPDDLRAMYYTKTFERLQQSRDSPVLEDLMEREYLEVNGKKLQGFPLLRDALKVAIEDLSKTTKGCIIHGDYCFSNILFDYGNQIIRLIDPRGSFGKVGIYGDPRYDIAKLRHSVAGRYDLIVSDLFRLFSKGESIELVYYPIGNYELLTAEFDRLVESIGYNPREIMLIEGLLFLSMLPLHRDRPRRQGAMFLRGIELLNKVFAHQYA